MKRTKITKEEFTNLFLKKDVQYIPIIITGSFGGIFIIDSANKKITGVSNDTKESFIDGIENKYRPHGIAERVDYDVHHSPNHWEMNDFFAQKLSNGYLEYFVIENWK